MERKEVSVQVDLKRGLGNGELASLVVKIDSYHLTAHIYKWAIYVLFVGTQ